jgi:myo-inositol-1(or 4)-monophosphatase
MGKSGELMGAVKEAAKILKKGFFEKKEVEKKGSVDLVTEYDRRIEEFLKERFAHLGVPVVAEESFCGKIPSSAVIIDPIDGTTNFIHQIPFVGISVALWVDGEPLEGVVCNPILDEIFWAKRGNGAFLNDEPIRVSETSRLIDALIATGFPYTKVERGRDYRFVLKSMERLLPLTRDIRRLGSAALDLCYVAAGRFDGFYEVGLRPWDVAAGVLIVTEAGGRVSDHRGEVYRFGEIVVATNGHIHDTLVANLGRWE